MLYRLCCEGRTVSEEWCEAFHTEKMFRFRDKEYKKMETGGNYRAQDKGILYLKKSVERAVFNVWNIAGASDAFLREKKYRLYPQTEKI